MNNIQKHIGQPIISLESKDIIGTVKNFLVENKKISLFTAFNDKEDVEFTFPASSLLSLGDDAVILKTEKNVNFEESSKKNTVLGLPIINQQGSILGYSKDLEFDDNFKIINIVCENKKIAFADVEEISTNLILIKGKYKTKKAKPFISKLNYSVNIQSESSNIPQNLPIITKSNKSEPQVPAKAVASIPTLLGRTITKNIEYKGRVILKAGTIVSQKVIDLALLSGTIKQLTYSTI